MTKLFNPSPTRITPEWLEAIADRIEVHTPSDPTITCKTAIFEIELDTEGYTHIRVGWYMSDPKKPHPNESYPIEVETKCRGSAAVRAGLGLYTRRDELLALLEILAYGNHF